MKEVTWESHAQIDFFLCPKVWQQNMGKVYADRTAALASYHFLLRGQLHTKVITTKRKKKKKKFDSPLADVF